MLWQLTDNIPTAKGVTMSWGTYYKYDGYLSRIGKDQIDEEIDERESDNRRIFAEMLAYMAMTPPAYAKDCEGHEYPWPEYIAAKMRQFQEELQDNCFLLARLHDCREVLREHPENVEEG